MTAGFAAKSTTNLSEGTNLYYTDARVDTRFDTRLATKSTTTAGKIGTWGTKALAKKATAKAAMAATKTGKFLASKTGKAVTSHLASSIMSPPQRSDEASKIRTNATAGFASMKFGTGGSRSAFTMKKSPIYDYKKGYYGV